MILAQKLEIGDFADEVIFSLPSYVVSDVDFCGEIGDENGSRPIILADFPFDEPDFADEIGVVSVVVWRGAIFRRKSSIVKVSGQD